MNEKYPSKNNPQHNISHPIKGKPNKKTQQKPVNINCAQITNTAYNNSPTSFHNRQQVY